MPLHLVGQLESPVGDGAHQINASPRTVILIAQFDVRWACRSAKTTVHTVEEVLVLDVRTGFGRDIAHVKGFASMGSAW